MKTYSMYEQDKYKLIFNDLFSDVYCASEKTPFGSFYINKHTFVLELIFDDPYANERKIADCVDLEDAKTTANKLYNYLKHRESIYVAAELEKILKIKIHLKVLNEIFGYDNEGNNT